MYDRNFLWQLPFKYAASKNCRIYTCAVPDVKVRMYKIRIKTASSPRLRNLYNQLFVCVICVTNIKLCTYILCMWSAMMTDKFRTTLLSGASEPAVLLIKIRCSEHKQILPLTQTITKLPTLTDPKSYNVLQVAAKFKVRQTSWFSAYAPTTTRVTKNNHL